MSADEPSLPRLPVAGTGKEELRATLILPLLLRLRAERGDAAVRALLATVGVREAVLEGDTAWISVSAARRTLAALATALGDEAIGTRGEWMTHPETLAAYVRMLRVASKPIDAYHHLCAHASEATRVGSYVAEELGPTLLRITYSKRSDSDSDQKDRLLCMARRAELAAVPRIWGQSEARVTDVECLAKGDKRCVYEVAWRQPSFRHGAPVGAALGGIACGALVATSGSALASGIATVLGAVLGATVGGLKSRVAEEQSSRTFEKNRIAALERGLEIRGQLHSTPGDLVGTVLGGKYRIARRIGSGGIGSVYAAEHVALGSKIAVKVLRGAAAADAAEIARLRREARVQVSIEHPNVVRTLDLDQMPDGSIYVVMELLSGESLAQRLKRRSPLAPGFAIPVFMQVCRALDAAHRLGIVHRDLKPGNVFLCDDRTVKVLDFGMSKLGEAESLTQEGYTLGTPEYMSPEQCIGAPLDGRADLYALGVMMYEAFTGELPIRGRNRRELLELHQRSTPISMRQRRPELGLPGALDQAVLACLRKKPLGRPETARELERMLAAVPPEGLVYDYPEQALHGGVADAAGARSKS
jgi:serine/threonine-protein kinase